MKTINFNLVTLAICCLLTAAGLNSFAQAPTPLNGPSDATTAPPATASAVAQVLCANGAIALKGPADATGTVKYDWYKVDNTGVKKLVKEGVNKDNVYAETASGAGYYTYQLVQVNGNGCTSDSSDPFNLYVLPPLTPAIAASNANVCEKNQSTSALTITGLDSHFTYTYQWTRNGTDIVSATTDSYTVSELTATTLNFGVKVAYTLSAGCTSTATQAITVNPVPNKPIITLN